MIYTFVLMSTNPMKTPKPLVSLSFDSFPLSFSACGIQSQANLFLLKT